MNRTDTGPACEGDARAQLGVDAEPAGDAAARGAEGRYRTLFDQAPDGIVIADANSYYLDANSSACGMLGYSREELIGLHASDIVVNEEAQHIAPALDVIKAKSDYHREWKFRRKDGTIFTAEVIATQLPDGNLLGMIRDVSERNRAEENIRQLNRVYAVLSEINQTIVREKDPQEVLSAACRIAVEKGRFCMAWIGLCEGIAKRMRLAAHAGASSDTLKIVNTLLGDSIDACGCAFTLHALRTGTHGACNDIASDPQTHQWRDGALERGYKAMASLPLSADGTTIGTFNLYACEPGFFSTEELRLLNELALNIGFALEVARRAEASARAERNLHASETRYREMLENLKLIAVMMDTDGHITFCNDYLLELTGWRREEIIGAKWYSKFVPESAPAVKNLISETTRFGEFPAHYQNPIVTRSGAFREIMWNNTVLRNAAGEMTGTASIGEDVTERMKAESALRDTEERFRQLAENINEVFWIMDSTTNAMLYVSPAYEKIWGRSCESVYAAPLAWLETIHEDDRDRIRHAALTKMVRGDYDETYRIMRADGSLRWINARGYPLRNAAGDVFRVVGTAVDITANRLLEQQLRQSQKMETIGVLAGGIAHDFNNLLSVITGYSDVLLMSGKLDEYASSRVREIRKAGERASSLTHQLLAFSRKQHLEPVVLDINQLVTDMEKMLRRLIGEDVELRSVLDPKVARIKADPGQIEQVIMNLIVNARDAMPTGGEISVETSNVQLDGKQPLSHGCCKAGNYVLLAVTDAGQGMDKETQTRIFEPFFTTKGVGKGTGLGLSTVYGIVNQSGGYVHVSSEINKGTTFKIYLPAAEGAVVTRATEKFSRPIPRGSETILVVEDEAAIRTMLQQMLESFGYTVLVADCGAKAAQMVGEHKGELHLVLTDVIMPKMDGRQLVQLLSLLLPGIKVLFMSGYTNDALGRIGEVSEIKPLLQKPFTPGALARKVREVLDAAN